MSKKIELYNEMIGMEIPEEFVLADNVTIEKYFLGQIPDTLYVNEEKDALISITKTELKIEKGNIEKRILEYFEIYQRSIANFANFKVAQKTIDGEVIATFYYTSTSAERNLLNFFTLLILESKEVIVTMHCNIEDSPLLGKKFMNTINSISFLGK